MKQPLSQASTFLDLGLPDGRRGRLVQIAITPRADAVDEEAETMEQDPQAYFEISPTLDPASVSVILSVARSREDFDALLTSLYLMFAGIGALLLLGIGILVRLTVSSGLAPIDAINKQICAIGPAAFERRIRLPFAPKELQTILHALNGLLERLQNTFERERRFSSNVAHELRTPVAELRSACEVGGKWPEDTASSQQFFSDIREIALQMEKTVTNLLMLARCDNGTATVNKEQVQIEPLIRQCWDRSLEKVRAKQLRLDFRVNPNMAVNTDREKFEMIIRNLLENAIAYSAPGTAITCMADNTDPDIDLVIENQAVGLAKEDLAHIFERFWRKDSARGKSHSGLGLSIVKVLCELLGISLRVELKEEALFAVRLSFSDNRARVGSVLT